MAVNNEAFGILGWVIAVLFALSGLAWMLLRKYLEKRMELLATKADLREQTQIIERAKAEQAASLWLSQERWREQKDTGYKIVEWLTKLSSAMSGLRARLAANLATLKAIEHLRQSTESTADKNKKAQALESEASIAAEALATALNHVLDLLNQQPLHTAKLLMTQPSLNADLGNAFARARSHIVDANKLKSIQEIEAALGEFKSAEDEIMQSARAVAAQYREWLGFNEKPVGSRAEVLFSRDGG